MIPNYLNPVVCPKPSHGRSIHKAVNPDTGRTITVEGAKKKAWTAISRYVRKTEPLCVTCGKPTAHAGHFNHNTDKKNKQLGGNELWYDIRNIHGQCEHCNIHKSGNLSLYSLFLEDKYGAGIIQELYKLFRTSKKWTITEILDIETKYNELYERTRQSYYPVG